MGETEIEIAEKNDYLIGYYDEKLKVWVRDYLPKSELRRRLAFITGWPESEIHCWESMIYHLLHGEGKEHEGPLCASCGMYHLESSDCAPHEMRHREKENPCSCREYDRGEIDKTGCPIHDTAKEKGVMPDNCTNHACEFWNLASDEYCSRGDPPSEQFIKEFCDHQKEPDKPFPGPEDILGMRGREPSTPCRKDWEEWVKNMPVPHERNYIEFKEWFLSIPCAKELDPNAETHDQWVERGPKTLDYRDWRDWAAAFMRWHREEPPK